MKEKMIIEGMGCNHCVHAVKEALGGVAGVEVLQVSLGEAEVAYDASVVAHAALVEAIEEEGYRVVETQPVAG